VPDSPGLRPTTDRVRETLFNWLAPSMVDAHCLDCFAGSGALGLEALSRYAASATLLEMERGVAQTLQQNLATLKASNAKVVNTNTLSFLRKRHAAYRGVCRSAVPQGAAGRDVIPAGAKRLAGG
jgi:16S rRNA (guanine966-N2)-methyltransferase